MRHEELQTLIARAIQVCGYVRSLDIGAHYCRYCPAKSPAWEHSPSCPYVESQREKDEARALKGELEALLASGAAAPRVEDEARRYLARLLTHYAPQCEPLSDLLGVCSQIDNLLTAATFPLAESPSPTQGAEVCVCCKSERPTTQWHGRELCGECIAWNQSEPTP